LPADMRTRRWGIVRVARVFLSLACGASFGACEPGWGYTVRHTLVPALDAGAGLRMEAMLYNNDVDVSVLVDNQSQQPVEVRKLGARLQNSAGQVLALKWFDTTDGTTIAPGAHGTVEWGFDGRPLASGALRNLMFVHDGILQGDRSFVLSAELHKK
jgi:hypothetical protein